jgi:hypothetical protein
MGAESGIAPAYSDWSIEHVLLYGTKEGDFTSLSKETAMQKSGENPAILEEEREQIAPSESPLAADPISTGRRVSDQTNIHDDGSDANDTSEGLTEIEEAVRQAAEDVPLGQRLEGSTESIPVFDRSSLPPKL